MHTGTYTIPSDWKIGGVEAFGHTLNLNTGTLDNTAAGTEHSYKYVTIPENPFNEIELWRNPQIASGTFSSFAGQTVTLSESIRNFDFIKITARASTTDSRTASIMMSLDNWLATDGGRNTNNFMLTMLCMKLCLRSFWYSSDTEVYCYQTDRYTSNGCGTSNTNIIPLYIHGVNIN